MPEKLKEQILAVRDTGRTNMLDVNMVQMIAFELEFYQLVDFIEVHRAEYIKFIMTGK